MREPEEFINDKKIVFYGQYMSGGNYKDVIDRDILCSLLKEYALEISEEVARLQRLECAYTAEIIGSRTLILETPLIDVEKFI